MKTNISISNCLFYVSLVDGVGIGNDHDTTLI